jgi:hypothetical protein
MSAEEFRAECRSMTEGAREKLSKVPASRNLYEAMKLLDECDEIVREKTEGRK